MAGDSKPVSCPNLAAIIAAGVEFAAPASKTYVDTAALAAQDLDAAVPVGRVAQRDEAEPAQARGSWRVVEDTTTLAGKRQADRALTPRRVLVWPQARAGAAKTARAEKLDRARYDLARLGRGLGGRHYPTCPGHGASRPACKPKSAPARPAAPPCPGTPTTTPGRRGRRRRLVRAAGQPRPGPGRRRRGPPTLQGPRRGRTPLRQPQRAARSGAHILEEQPAHRGADQRHLPGSAGALPRRTGAAPGHRPGVGVGWAWPASRPSPPDRSSSRLCPGSGSSPPPPPARPPSPNRPRCRPGSSSCSASTQPGLTDPSGQRMTGPLHPDTCEPPG